MAPRQLERNINELLARAPFASFMGVHATIGVDGLTIKMPFRQELVGNVRLPTLHGGVTGAFLELTALAQGLWITKCTRYLKTIDLTVSYLRPGRTADTWGRAEVTKQGRSVAHVSCTAWQEDRHRPIATAQGHFFVIAAPSLS